MPFKCCVPYCRGNYDSDNKVAIFKFPKDEKLKNIWISKISREDFVLTEHSRVCEHHFAVSDIQKTTEAFNEKTGTFISAPLDRARLKKGAFPTIFQNYPSYKTSSETSCSTDDPDSKRLRREASHIQKAVQESLLMFESYQNSRVFGNINELLDCLKRFKISKFWNVVDHGDCLMILNLKKDEGNIKLIYGICIDATLNLTVSCEGVAISKIGLHTFPLHVTNMNKLIEVLDMVEYSDMKNTTLVDGILSLLESLNDSSDNIKEKQINFIKEQLLLSVTKPEKYRYLPDTLIFASMFFLASPVAYKLVRNSGEIILPHVSTIHKLCAKFNINPQDEVKGNNFLAYAKQRQKLLKSEDLNVSLMIDEIHLKECFDFKGGNIVGHSYNNVESANSAHVFMLQSLFSKFKDVIYILPVKTITANVLFSIVKHIIITLEELGYRVIVVVSDNNSINRKCISLFGNPLSDYVYPHPCNQLRPLFYCIDPVHLIKSVRNNWVNQRNNEQAMYFPDFNIQSDKVLTASLLSVKKLYDLESGSLFKHGYNLTQKVLWPSSLEKQNVKLALQLLNLNVSISLLNLGPSNNIPNYSETAEYIKIFHRWFTIMNVKSPNKGFHLRDTFAKPLTISDNDEKLIFLNEFIEWLKKWKLLKSDTGRLTRETFSALLITSTCIIELTRYCVEELGMKYLLPGKVQTDELENRFSLYRRMAGTNYHISMRQILEVEKKLRTCNVLKLALGTTKNIFVREIIDFNETEDQIIILNETFLSIEVTDTDLSDIKDEYPLLTFLAGYCVHSALYVKLKCDECKNNLTIDKTLAVESTFKIICSFDRGGLKYPTIDVVNIVAHNFIVLKKIINDNEDLFLKESNQREVVTQLTLNVLLTKEMLVKGCEKHSFKKIMLLIIRSCTNTLLKNYCKSKNDVERKKTSSKVSTKQKKRKLAAISDESGV